MSSGHHETSPSGAERWLACPGSVIRSRGIEDKGSVYAEEGSKAHAVAEMTLRALMGGGWTDPGDYLEPDDMLRHAVAYAEYINNLGHFSEYLIEARLDLDFWIPGAWGTGDFVGLVGTTLHVVDYKYGQGVQVEAKENPQLKCYGLGALAWMLHRWAITDVVLHIFQPRRNHIDSWATTPIELITWGAEVLRPGALLAMDPDAPVKAGEHCQFCKARGRCPEQLAAVQKAASIPFLLLGPDELAEAYALVPMVEKWIDGVTCAALNTARETGLPGYKFVEGRSVRKWRNPAEVAAALEAIGAQPYKPREVLGITEVEKILPKKVVAELTVKPPGKPTLVPDSDKRPEIPQGSAIFENVENEDF